MGLLVLAGLGLVFGLYWAQRGGPPPDEAPPPAPRVVAPPRREEPPAAPVEPAAPAPAPSLAPVGAGQARIALVIDDLGRSPADVRRLQALRIPWTAAVLPFESRTAEVVSALEDGGVEYLCHLPMEGVNANPGPGALRVDMTKAELSAATSAALRAVPGAVGVNNHMGSVFSADASAMASILAELSARGLFFVDSRTSAASVGYRMALERGIPAAERQVFLDSDPAPEAVTRQFERLLEVARRRGSAVAIGHPHRDTLAVLETEVPRALAAGYEFVPASFLLDRPSTAVEH